MTEHTYTKEDEAYFQSEVDHAKRRAKETLAEFLQNQNGIRGINKIHELIETMDEGELGVLVTAIGILEDEAKEEEHEHRQCC
jgi:hypothetical protein